MGAGRHCDHEAYCGCFAHSFITEEVTAVIGEPSAPVLSQAHPQRSSVRTRCSEINQKRTTHVGTKCGAVRRGALAELKLLCVPVLETQKKCVEVVQPTLEKSNSERIVERIIDVLLSLSLQFRNILRLSMKPWLFHSFRKESLRKSGLFHKDTSPGAVLGKSPKYLSPKVRNRVWKSPGSILQARGAASNSGTDRS